jgi:hypothetical protein
VQLEKMKNLDKIKLIDMIASELQEQMTFSEIDSYFETYKIPTDHTPSYNSKKVYVKEVLPQVLDEIILEIAEELELKHSYGKVVTKEKIIIRENSSLWKSGHYKLFLSHLASFKVTISQLKNELEKYGISSFVAHEDIEPAKEWQVEIEKGLFSMDALCAILMPGFNDSKWTDQEIGFALGRELLIIPVRKDLDPYGFIGKYQGIQAKGKNIGQVAEAIFNIISTHDKTKSIYISNIVDLLLLSNDVTEIKNRINSINKINNFPVEKAKQIHERITENKNFNKLEALKLINAFFMKNGLEKISKSNFDHNDSQVYDDLPF